MVNREDPRRGVPPVSDIERDPTLTGASTRSTQGAAPDVQSQRLSGDQQQSSGGGMDTDQMKDKAADVKDKAADAAGTAKDKASEMTHKATDKVDERRGQTAETMDTAAAQLRERGESLPGGERTTEMASMAADKVEATSTYIRDHDVDDMMTDLETFVRSHPTQSLVAAGVAGFLVGRMLRG